MLGPPHGRAVWAVRQLNLVIRDNRRRQNRLLPLKATSGVLQRACTRKVVSACQLRAALSPQVVCGRLRIFGRLEHMEYLNNLNNLEYLKCLKYLKYMNI